MRVETSHLRLPASIGLAVTAPFLILELGSNGSNGLRVFELEYLVGVTILFAILWALPTGFILVLRPLLVGDGVGTRALSVMIRLVVMVLIAWLWVALIVDQWPCFTGVPNCD